VFFTAQGIQKYVDVAKLVKAKYQDNLEFFQWFKSWFDSKYNPSDYDPKSKRDAAIKAKGGKLPAPAPTAAAKPAASKVAKAPAAAPKPKPVAPAATAMKKPTASPAKAATKKTGDEKQEVEELNGKMAKLRATIEGLEKSVISISASWGP